VASTSLTLLPSPTPSCMGTPDDDGWQMLNQTLILVSIMSQVLGCQFIRCTYMAVSLVSLEPCGYSHMEVPGVGCYFVPVPMEKVSGAVVLVTVHCYRLG
jgi:hypothetical protein